MYYLFNYLETDPEKKTLEWGERMVYELRQTSEWLVDPVMAKENMEYLLGAQNMKSVKESFHNPADSKVNFTPMKVMEKVRNIMVAETENAGIGLTVNSIDPTVVDLKQSDRKRLANRGFIEAHMSTLQTSIGNAPYKLNNAKKDDGTPVFEGNVNKFDELALDDRMDEDLDYFFATYYRLRHEIKAEQPINYFVKYNELTTLLPQLTNDIMAKKAIALATSINEVTGAVDVRYLAPETVRVIAGRRLDYKDARAVGYEQSVSVSQLVGMLGSEIDIERDIQDIIRAINFSNHTEYSGVVDDSGRVRIMGGNNTGEVSMGRLMQLSVTLGYMEWKTVDAVAYKKGKNWHGNYSSFRTSLVGRPGERSFYEREVTYAQKTYRAYYLATGVNYQQRLFKFGPLPFQRREGGSDEYSGYSICLYKDVGSSAVEIAKPHIDIIETAEKKFQYILARAKRPGRGYNIDVLQRLAEMVIDSTDAVDTSNKGGISSKFMKVIEFLDESENELYANQTDDNGNPVGGNAQPNYDVENGIRESAMRFMTVVQDRMLIINDLLGISPLREAYSPNPKDGFKMQMQALDYSRKATQYVSRMLGNVFQNTAERILACVQYAIEFKDRYPLPYKFLLRALGEQSTTDLADLTKASQHRYAIFVEEFNAHYDKEQQRLYAEQAFMQGEIPYETLMLLKSIDSPKQAAQTLAFEKRRAQRQAMDAKRQEGEMASNLETQKHNQLMERIVKEGELEVEAKRVEGDYYMRAHEATAKATIESRKMQLEAKPAEIEQRKDADIQKAQAIAELTD
jgi:hypothetical protein